MSTRTDIGLLQPQKPKKFVPWFSDLPVWETTLPGTPKQAAYHLTELAKDVSPVEGQRRSAIRSAQETARAKGLLEEGKYLEALPHGIWAGVESLDVALSALPVAGAALAAPLDLARAGKRLLSKEPKVGININDKTQNFTGQILSGKKNIETRDSHSLKNLVGKRVGLIKTGKGQAQVVGYADVGNPKVYKNQEDFRKDQSQHLVKPGSAFDIKEGGTKFGYPLTNVEKVEPYPVTSQGIVSRKIKRPPLSSGR